MESADKHKGENNLHTPRLEALTTGAPGWLLSPPEDLGVQLEQSPLTGPGTLSRCEHITHESTPLTRGCLFPRLSPTECAARALGKRLFAHVPNHFFRTDV